MDSCFARVGLLGILVLLQNEKLLKAVEHLAEDKCAIWCGPDLTVSCQAMPFFGTYRNMMGFVDRQVMGELWTMAKGMGIQTLFGTKGLQQSFLGWTSLTQCVDHSAKVGGVTTGLFTLTAMT